MLMLSKKGFSRLSGKMHRVVTEDTKSERIVTYLEPKQRSVLEAWAKAESRTLPELARLLLEDAITRRRLG